MIDSVLKGTGNSRFLKSAVPAGTSWADALAMLQAGTFPIDFNGINTEGFQQIGTPLNKANLLKDATAAQIGLPTSTTPDDMFQALGNTGELHVWRKTVVSKTPGYNLSVAQKNYLSSGSNYGSGNSRVTFTVSASVSVADDGTVTQNSPSSETYIYHQDVVSNVQNQIRGKFVSISTDHTSGYYSEPQDGIWFVPSDANITLVENGTSLGYPYNYCYVADKMQKVTGYGKGTTATYPVSPNPNAYQEGSNANTIIEYLGKLGNKARVQVVSYVGTGTYGSSNPNSLTFDFVPKILFVVGDYDSGSPGFLFATVQASYIHYPYSSQSGRPIFPFWNKTVKWYYDGAESQLNLSGRVYDGIAIG